MLDSVLECSRVMVVVVAVVVEVEVVVEVVEGLLVLLPVYVRVLRSVTIEDMDGERTLIEVTKLSPISSSS